MKTFDVLRPCTAPLLTQTGSRGFIQFAVARFKSCVIEKKIIHASDVHVVAEWCGVVDENLQGRATSNRQGARRDPRIENRKDEKSNTSNKEAYRGLYP